MIRHVAALLLFTLLLIQAKLAPEAHAATEAPVTCTLILDAKSGRTIRREGSCDERFSPASTFKVPLALMGYDEGILKDAHAPAWSWRPGLEAPKRDRKTVDPTIWERDSVLWYSREITRHLGREKFAAYVAKLGYGNQDVSGDAGKNNGLSHAWLSSSLAISPVEQVTLIRKLLSDTLPVNPKAQALTRAIIPGFDAAGGWRVYGKTGSGWLRDGKGEYDMNRPVGWFIGWARKGEQGIIFAHLDVGNRKADRPKGPMVRDRFLAQLPKLMRP